MKIEDLPEGWIIAISFLALGALFGAPVVAIALLERGLG